MNEAIVMSGPPFRRGTELKQTKFNFAYNAGGIGDFIQWTTAIRYAIETSPQISGFVHAPDWFADLANLWLLQYEPRYLVITGKRLQDDERLDGIPAIIPDGKQINASATHLFDLGFQLYVQKPVPQGWREVPRVEGDEADVSRFGLPKDYAVIPTHATAANRRLPAGTIDDLSIYFKRRGITPVYIGRKDLAHDYTAGCEPFNTLLGIDLRERTSLVEAAVIMARARLTVGIDGGMLHLACCGPAPVIFGFTSVSPLVRIPPRRFAARTAVVTPPKSLECRFCNTEMRFVFDDSGKYHHDFKECLYGDNLCTQAFTLEAFVPAIEDLLKEDR